MDKSPLEKDFSNWTSYDEPITPPYPKRRTKPMNALGFLWAMWRNPLTIWGDLTYREEIIIAPSVRGDVVVINGEEGIQHSFVKRAKFYRRDSIVRRVLEPALGQGLFIAEGEDWKRQRRIMAPVFSPRNIDKLTDKMAQVCDDFAKDLTKTVKQTELQGEAFHIDFAQSMTQLTFYILSGTLFSGDIALQEDGKNEKSSQENEADFFEAITKYVESFGKISPLEIFNAPKWVPRYSKWKTKDALSLFHRRVDETIAKRQARIQTGEELSQDLLSFLLRAEDDETGKGLSDKEIKDNIITFIGAGHETTARAMSWAFYLISKQPHLMQSLHEEAVSVMDAKIPSRQWLEKMPLTRAAIEETMRLYPPGAALIRESLEEDEIMGRKIPKGTATFISTFVLHRHKKLWDKPDQFMPERFLPENREKIPRHAYLPFGVGPRICIGAQFAMHEAVIILATLSKYFSFNFVGSHPPQPVQRITLRPKGGVELRLQRRLKP